MNQSVVPIFNKYPAAKLTFGFDWSKALGNDSLTDCQISVVDPPDSALTVSNVQATNKIVTFRLSGGTAGKTYVVRCHAAVASGDEVEGYFYLSITPTPG